MGWQQSDTTWWLNQWSITGSLSPSSTDLYDNISTLGMVKKIGLPPPSVINLVLQYLPGRGNQPAVIIPPSSTSQSPNFKLAQQRGWVFLLLPGLTSSTQWWFHYNRESLRILASNYPSCSLLEGQKFYARKGKQRRPKTTGSHGALIIKQECLWEKWMVPFAATLRVSEVLPRGKDR